MNIPRALGAQPENRLLGEVQFRLAEQFPLLGVFATKIYTGPSLDAPEPAPTLVFRITFDGAPFGEALHFEGQIPFGDTQFVCVPGLLRECERQVAEAIRGAR